MHDALVDHIFGAAPGEWTMHACVDCGGGYLDPRPTQETIGLAYTRYYTHEQKGSSAMGLLARIRRGIAESYRNHRLGTDFPGAMSAGHVVAYCFPRLRRFLDVSYARHLPPTPKHTGRLLDVGCGNGEFLQCASALGWDAEGIDPDAAAISAAEAAGCRVRQATLDHSGLASGTYQQITMSHVIEHVPSPGKLLERCFELLAPGGRLWLETPNVESLGHQLFGAAWRGLEPPRHLVLFNRKSLQRALVDAGFENIEFKAHPAVTLFMWEGSRTILGRMVQHVVVPVRVRLMRSLVGAVLADYWSIIRPGSSEFITCIAYRPTVASVRPA